MVKQVAIRQRYNNERFDSLYLVSKGAHCITSDKVCLICDSGNEQVKYRGKPQATQPYLRTVGRKNVFEVVRLRNFYVSIERY